MDLSPGQLEALRNLARKREGAHVPFINISDARALTGFGLAARSREGWDITSAGAEHLAGMGRPGATD